MFSDFLWRWGTCGSVSVWRSEENLWESVLLFYHVESQDQSHVIKLGFQCTYLLSQIIYDEPWNNPCSEGSKEKLLIKLALLSSSLDPVGHWSWWFVHHYGPSAQQRYGFLTHYYFCQEWVHLSFDERHIHCISKAKVFWPWKVKYMRPLPPKEAIVPHHCWRFLGYSIAIPIQMVNSSQRVAVLEIKLYWVFFFCVLYHC